jgi:hypothetical protein
MILDLDVVLSMRPDILLTPTRSYEIVKFITVIHKQNTLYFVAENLNLKKLV